MTMGVGAVGPTFRDAIAELPTGHSTGSFNGGRWGLTVTRSGDGRRLWLYAEELGGRDIVSFNLYRFSDDRLVLKPCEMSASKVVEFVLGFQPGSEAARGLELPNSAVVSR
ncbi:MAG: hypothetical protein ACK4N1_14995 [Pseudorhizobium sp.]